MFKTTFSRTSKMIMTGAITFIIAGCAGGVYPARAQSGDNIRVLVMGEDSDPRSVKRSSDIFKRVLAEMKDSMGRHGFRMVDEEMVGVDLGWNMTERRPKRELIQAVKLMNSSPKASHHVRAMTVFSIHAYRKDLGFANKIEVRIDGEVYDAKSNQFIASFELPRKSYSAPADCNGACISEVVGDHAREIALSLGDVLGKKLSYLSPDNRSGYANDGAGLKVPYTITFKHFTAAESLEVINVMTSEFPGYVSYELSERSPALRRYDYVTTAKSAKMEEWIHVLLNDMDLKVGRDVEILFMDTEIILDKIIARPMPTRNTGGRFQ